MAIPPQVAASLSGGQGGIDLGSSAKTGDQVANTSKQYSFGAGPTLNKNDWTKPALILAGAVGVYLIAKKAKVI